MIEPYLRPLYQNILGDPAARLLGKFLSPNKVTLLGILVGMGIIPVLYYGFPLSAFCLLILSGILDTVDGTVARLFYQNSSYGAALDIVGDRIVEFSVLLGLFLISPETRALTSFIMLGSILICVTSFLVVGIFSENDSTKSFHYSPGLMERPEAFMFFGLMILFPEIFQLLALLFSFLVFLTALVRMFEFKRAISPLPSLKTGAKYVKNKGV